MENEEPEVNYSGYNSLVSMVATIIIYFGFKYVFHYNMNPFECYILFLFFKIQPENY